jgi:NAD(P)-dependent dehydrogenase (short-subunit alcohol dehydrogenase family)
MPGNSFPSDGQTPTGAASEPKVWFITHTRQAFGAELIRQVLARGDHVIGALSGMQSEPALFGPAHARYKSIRMDLSSPVDVERGIAWAIEAYGRIDYLVNAACEGLAGAVEETSDEEAQKVINASLLAPLRVTRAVLAHMRAQRSGRIIQVLSLSRTEGLAGYGLYNAARGALSALSESLAAEVRPFNISVSLIDPIPFAADYAADSLSVTRRMIDDYYDTSGRTRRNPENPFRLMGTDPVSGVEAILSAITAPEPPQRLIMGREALERAVSRLDTKRLAIAKWRETALAAESVA